MSRYLLNLGPAKDPVISGMLQCFFESDEYELSVSPRKSNGLIPKPISKLVLFLRQISRKCPSGKNVELIYGHHDFNTIFSSVHIAKNNSIPSVIFYSSPHGLSKIFFSDLSLGSYFRIGPYRAHFSRFIYNWCLRNASSIIVVSPAFKQYMIDQGIPGEKIYVQPMGAPESFLEFPSRDVSKEYDLVYLGTHDRPRELSNLIRTISILKPIHPDIKLLMLGGGSDKPDLITLTRQLNLQKNIIFKGPVDREHIPYLVSQARIGVSPIPVNPVYEVSSPTKLMEYLSLGLPVVANREIPDQEYVVNQSRGGVLCDFLPESFASVVGDMLSRSREELNEMGLRGREWIGRERSYKLLAEKLKKHFVDIIEKHQSESNGA